MAYFLPHKVDFFPHPLLADPDGCLAVGSRLSEDTLLLAYNFGIFPWSSEEEPLIWCFTYPRCVLIPDRLKVAKSMRPYLNGSKFSWTIDQCFTDVMEACKNINRKNQSGTWIYDELQTCFSGLHDKGYAHSVEVWSEEGKLVGGLYGLALGNIFFGESMFSLVSNASKFGFINFVNFLAQKGFTMIDCQQETAHLMSLGAETISAQFFLQHLRKNILVRRDPCKWRIDDRI